MTLIHSFGVGSLDGSCARWQPEASIWTTRLLTKHYGQWRTQVWLGHVYICWFWPFGVAR